MPIARNKLKVIVHKGINLNFLYEGQTGLIQRLGEVDLCWVVYSPSTPCRNSSNANANTNALIVSILSIITSQTY